MAGIFVTVIVPSTIACVAHVDPPDPLPRVDVEIGSYVAALAQPLLKYDRRTENLLYYAIANSIATERNWLWKLLPQVPLSRDAEGSSGRRERLTSCATSVNAR